MTRPGESLDLGDRTGLHPVGITVVIRSDHHESRHGAILRQESCGTIRSVLVVLALAAIAILAGVVAVAMGRGGELTEFAPDVPLCPCPTPRSSAPWISWPCSFP
nr:hypothetical protein GCM10020093_060240 [Planobispora longispora]